ncbi:thioredoxin, mitochondrial isoform X1 [Lampetra planeri]
MPDWLAARTTCPAVTNRRTRFSNQSPRSLRVNPAAEATAGARGHVARSGSRGREVTRGERSSDERSGRTLFLQQMAHRQVLRRLVVVQEAVSRAARGFHAPLSSSSLLLTTPLSRPLDTTWTRSARGFTSTATRAVSFHVQDVDDFTERVVNSDTPVVVDFHAQWCGPCKILGPRLEKLVAKQSGKVLMAKVDIDDHTDLAVEYGVSAVPTVLAMRNGSVVDKFVGVRDEDQLEVFLKKLVSPVASAQREAGDTKSTE